jgi:putative ABC transport system substrate-binding protein
MRRREFLGALGGVIVAVPAAPRAQQPAPNTPKIGLLWPGITAPASPRMESFQRGLREQGYVDGRNVRVELRFAREGMQALPTLVAELVHMNVDGISTFGTSPQSWRRRRRTRHRLLPSPTTSSVRASLPICRIRAPTSRA